MNDLRIYHLYGLRKDSNDGLPSNAKDNSPNSGLIPSTTRSIAYLRSLPVTHLCKSRAASKAASLQTLAISAPLIFRKCFNSV